MKFESETYFEHIRPMDTIFMIIYIMHLEIF